MGGRAGSVIVCIITLFFLVGTIVVSYVPFLYNTINSVLGGERLFRTGDSSEYMRYVSDYGTKEDTLAAAKSSLERIFNARESLDFYVKNAPAGEISAEVSAKLSAHKEKFITVMDDDFNTADGTATIFELVSDVFGWVREGVSKGSAEAALALLDEYK